MLSSNTIPAWLIAIAMIYTGYIWLLTRKRSIKMDSRVFATTFVVWGIVYGVIFQVLDLDVEIRGFLSRLMLLIVCISQSVHLTISYLRSDKDDHR